MPNLTRRLTTLDASFLYTEKRTQPMHVGSVMIYEGRITRAEMMKVLTDRMHLLPRYRQKVVFPPFGLAHPTWEDDPNFDIGNHIEEVDMPAPVDERTISKMGGAAFAKVLDRDHPLWKIVLLHGLPGKTVSISMVHHAMVDGVSGIDLTMVMHDLTRDADPPTPPAGEWEPTPIPDPITRMQDAVRDRLTEQAQTFTNDLFRWLRPEELAARTRQFIDSARTSMPSMLQPVPATPFNGMVSDQREFGWCELNFADIRYIRSILGGTVNDVVLTIIAGGLARYLRSHGWASNVELRAMCPVSMRRPDQQGDLGNLVSVMLAPLFCNIDDPVERLQAERDAMNRLKEQDQAGGFYAMTEFGNQVPPALQALGAGFNFPQTLLNTVSTNVPGPQIPLYMNGRQLLSWYPLGPLGSNLGLFNAILTYNQKLTIGPTCDPNLMPDVWVYVDCLRESFEELMEAARQVGADEVPPPAAIVVPAARAEAPAPAKRTPAARKPATRKAGGRRSAAKTTGRTTAAAAPKTTTKAAAKTARKRKPAQTSGPAATTPTAPKTAAASTSSPARAAKRSSRKTPGRKQGSKAATTPRATRSTPRGGRATNGATTPTPRQTEAAASNVIEQARAAGDASSAQARQVLDSVSSVPPVQPEATSTVTNGATPSVEAKEERVPVTAGASPSA